MLTLLDEPPPEGYGESSGALLTEALGNVSDHQVWRVLRKHHALLTGAAELVVTKITDSVRNRPTLWAVSESAGKHVVFCVDEKPSIRHWKERKGG